MDEQRKSKAELISEIKGLRRQLADLENANSKEYPTEEQDSLLTQRYRSFIEHTTDAVFCYEYEPPIPINLPIEEQITILYQGVLVECNKVSAQSYGASRPDEVLGKRLEELSQASPGGLNDFFKSFIESDYRAEDLAGTSTAKDGTVRYYSTYARGKTKNGKLVRVWGSFREITGAKRAEIALRESEERYRRLAEQAPDIIYRIRFSPEYRFEYINPAFTQVTGYTAEEFFENPELTAALVYPEDMSLIMDSQQGILPSGPTRIRWIHKDGSLIWTEQHTRRVFDDEDNFIALEGIARDITEKIKTEDAYKESEARLQLAIKSTQMVIWVWNIQTRETSFSEGVDILFGVEPGSFPMPFSSFLAMVHPEDQERLNDEINTYSSVEEDGAFFTVQFRIIWPNAEVHWLEAKGTVIRDTAGQPERLLGTLVDVTQRVTVAQALEESEERYRRFSEAVQDGVLIHDLGIIIDANQALADIFLFDTPEEMIGLNGVTDLIHPDFQKLALQQIATQADVGPVEFVGLRQDGTSFPLEIEARGISFKGQSVRVLVGRDITERVRAEEALVSSETRLRLALEASGMGTWEWNIPTNEVIWSDNVEEIFGLSPGTFEGTYEAYLNLIYPADRDRLGQVVAEFVANSQKGDHYHIEHRLMFPDGQIRWMEGQGRLFRDSAGQPLKMIGTVLDITVRKQAEEALKASETSLKEAQKLAHLGNYELDLDTYQLEWSDEMYQIHGVEKSDLTSGDKGVFDTLIHPEDLGRTWDSTQRIIQSGQPESIDFRVVRPDGNIRYVHGQSQLRKNDKNKPSHLIGTVQDITDRKLAELAVQHTADRLQVIHDIDQAVLAAKSPKEIAQASLMSIRQVLPCDFAGVVLFNFDTDIIDPLAAEFDPEVQFVDLRDPALLTSKTFNYLLKKLREERVFVIQDTDDQPQEILSLTSGPLEARSGILTAIISQNELIGAINLVSMEPNHFSNEDIEIAAEFADSLAIAIQHARLLADQQRYTDQLESLRQASLQLTSSLELEPILDTVLEYVLSLVSALDAHIFLYDGAQLTFGAARWADNRPIQPFKKIRETGLTSTVARSGERIVIPEVNSHPLFQDWQWGGAIIGLPLLKADKVIGVMTVAFEKPHRFSIDELRILDLLADQVAIAIDNANLYSSETIEKRNTAALAASARDLSAVLDQDHIFQLTLDHLKEVVPYDSASLILMKNGQLEFVAERGFTEAQDVENFRKEIGGILPLEQELMKSRKPIIIPDVTEDELWKPGAMNRRVRSWLGVPLITGVQTLGFLMLDKYEPGFYTESSAALAGAFASHAAIALQNARLFENERRQTRQLEGLHQLSTEISAQLDIDSLLETTAQYAIDLLGGNSGGLYLYQPDREIIEWSIAIGESVVSVGSTLNKGEGLSGKVSERGEPLNVGDYRKWEGQAKIYEGYPWNSVIGAPISRGDTFYGVLTVLTDEMDAFSDSDQKVLDLFTTHVAIALENVQLFDRLNQRNHELAMLYDLGQHLTRQLDLNSLLKTIASAVVTSISTVEASSIWLLEPGRERLKVHAWEGHPDEIMDGMSVPISKSLAGQIYTSKQAKIFQDVQNEATFYKFGSDPVDDVCAVMGVPLIFESQIIGVMFADNFKHVDAFSEDDLQFFQSLAGAASVAIQNARLFDSVNLQSVQLRDLTTQLAALEELERKRLAQELHDRVGQNLTALSINLNMVKTFLPAESEPILGNRLDDSQVLVEETAQHIRDVMADLRPPVLDDYGLIAALRWYGGRFTNRTGISVTIQGDENAPRLNLTLETTLFRIAQEALTNISRHAEAGNVLIEVNTLPGSTQFVIADDGLGFETTELNLAMDKPGWGLQIMQERIEAIGGEFLIESPPEGGTVIKVEVTGRS